MNPRGARVTRLLLTMALSLPARPVRAAWPSDPNVNLPLCVLTNDQYHEAIAPDGAGGAIVAWSDDRTGGPGNLRPDIYAQHVLASGAVDPTWPANGLAVCTAVNGQRFPAIVEDSVGGAIVVWGDSRSGATDVYAQHLLSTGAVDPAWPSDGRMLGHAFDNNFASRQIVSDGAGGGIVAWTSYPRSGSTVYAQRISGGGVVQWDPAGVALSTAGRYGDGESMISDGQGGAILTWFEYEFSGTEDVYAQRISSTGIPQWTSNPVAVCTAPRGQGSPEIVPDGAAGALVAWEDYRNDNGLLHNPDIFAQHLLSTGALDPAWPSEGLAICTAVQEQRRPMMISDGVGGAIVTWDDRRSGNFDIYAQRTSAAGVPQWSATGLALCSASNDQTNPLIISDGANGAIVAWEDDRSGPDIYAQRVSSTGSAQWADNGVALCTAANSQFDLALAPDGTGGGIAAWQDYRSGTDYDIYAQRVKPSGELGGTVTGTIVMRFDAVQVGGSIVVRWELADQGAFLRVALERSAQEMGPWTAVTGERREEGGVSVVTDRLSESGRECWYRLVAVSADGETVFGPILVAMSAQTHSILAPPAPNPARNLVRVRFATATESTVRISVLDVAGREVAVLSQGRLGPGQYVALWDCKSTNGRVADGLYVLRYLVGDEALSRSLEAVSQMAR